jgi:undecaprenyl-diphosphatase
MEQDIAANICIALQRSIAYFIPLFVSRPCPGEGIFLSQDLHGFAAVRYRKGLLLTIIQAVVLGLIQGFTEFLPVSSSGHLVLAQKLFGLDGELLTFDIMVHFGTLLAVLAVFRRSVVSITLGTLKGLKAFVFDRTPLTQVYRDSHDVRMAAAIIIGTIPAVIIGLTLKDSIEALFDSVAPVLIALAVTGVVLLITFLVKKGERRIGILRGLIVGIAQTIAIIPGVSRSGSTISTALFLKVERREAGEFSFLLAVPAIAGATLLAVGDLSDGAGDFSLPVILLGVGSSFVSGYLSLLLLLRIIRKGKIGYFGYYCLAVSIAGLAYLYLR